MYSRVAQKNKEYDKLVHEMVPNWDELVRTFVQEGLDPMQAVDQMQRVYPDGHTEPLSREEEVFLVNSFAVDMDDHEEWLETQALQEPNSLSNSPSSPSPNTPTQPVPKEKPAPQRNSLLQTLRDTFKALLSFAVFAALIYLLVLLGDRHYFE